MKNMSDEELINQAAGFSCGCDKCLARVEPPRKELLSRLERGRIAIEAMKEIIEADSKEVESDEFNVQLYHIIDDYQQSCEGPPMETRSLIIQVPKPDEDELCSTTCELLPCCPYTQEVNFNEMEIRVIALKPGPGCPWHLD